jgi:xanthine dehydrogenase molybdopterin-binding subunit B
VKVRRNGGGFGGKISRHMAVAGAAAVAAAALRAPVMVCNERVDDLVMTGGREEMIAEYDAAYGADGVVHALRMELPCNMGW